LKIWRPVRDWLYFDQGGAARMREEGWRKRRQEDDMDDEEAAPLKRVKTEAGAEEEADFDLEGLQPIYSQSIKQRNGSERMAYLTKSGDIVYGPGRKQLRKKTTIDYAESSDSDSDADEAPGEPQAKARHKSTQDDSDEEEEEEEEEEESEDETFVKPRRGSAVHDRDENDGSDDEFEIIVLTAEADKLDLGGKRSWRWIDGELKVWPPLGVETIATTAYDTKPTKLPDASPDLKREATATIDMLDSALDESTKPTLAVKRSWQWRGMELVPSPPFESESSGVAVTGIKRKAYVEMESVGAIKKAKWF